jgi:hypothetical protein
VTYAALNSSLPWDSAAAPGGSGRFPRDLTTDIDGPLRFKAIERVPHPRAVPPRLGGEVLPPCPLENVLELVGDELDGMPDRWDVYPPDYDASGIRSHPRAGPTLRIAGLAPFEDDNRGRIGEFETLLAKRRRPLPAFFDDAEERWLDDEPARPRRNANRCRILLFREYRRVPNQRPDHRNSERPGDY